MGLSHGEGIRDAAGVWALEPGDVDTVVDGCDTVTTGESPKDRAGDSIVCSWAVCFDTFGAYAQSIPKRMHKLQLGRPSSH
jgi:hypothetical protein